MSKDTLLERYGWWASLNHGGMLIAPSKLAGRFEETIDPLPEWRASRLRRDVLRARDGKAESVSALLDTLFEDIVGLHRVRWVKGADVSKDHTRTSNAGEALRPARMWIGDNGARLAVFYPDQPSGGLRVPSGYRIGVGRGRRAVVRVVEWLRKSNEKIALVVTGRQLRLVHAGADYEAFCEWDTDLWFQEGAPGPQVDALRLLLSSDSLTPAKPGSPSLLLGAIAESRKGQAELSGALGERVRQAVELLIQASGSQLLPLVQDKHRRVEERDVYLAATRLIMRCVIVLFAEARELLPRTNPIYEQSYGLQALRVELERQSGGRASERLRSCYGAWPRLLGLFSLMFHGSEHEALPLTRYGGGLFEPGDDASNDPVSRAIGAFERADVRDADVQRILELLTRCPTRVRQGRGSTTVQTPVDFSDLGSEYLGILYEGLLDYELKRAGDDEAVLFLGVGSEPALPFDVLNDMSNAELAELLKKLGKATKGDDEDTEETELEEEEEKEDDEALPEADDVDGEAEPEPVAGDGRQVVRQAIQIWAERAVNAAKLVPYPRKDLDARVRDAFARKVTARAKALVRRLVLPGEWYLVRWGGTRKGAGTFYTRPQLAGPIVRRTLAPLCFEEAGDGQDPRPRKPEQILGLKVCDPAMGSGSFLVSALRYLTDALLQSLYEHGRLEQHGERWYVRLADGLPLDDPSQESLPAPKDDDNLDDILRARLKRHVVERCLYGVDLDALAVELARAALWVETMDYQLPFGFLDHKLKCGNSLVGGWLDRFEDYPIRAWDREAGDAKHTNFVRHFREEKGKRKGDVWNASLKLHREKTVLPLLVSALKKLKAEVAGQTLADFETHGKNAVALHAEAMAVFEELHAIIPIFEAERRAEVYKTKVLGNPALNALRHALDAWCAIWFWPADKLSIAPTPEDLLSLRSDTRREVERLAREMRFFHWELEFPDVMTGPAGGFAAIVGNPPWEIQKPNSMEFFSNEDPLYRTYGKQEALRKQRELFGDRESVEDRWLRYNARFKALSNWTKHAAFPFGAEEQQGEPLGGIDVMLLEIWGERRFQRSSFADRRHPFRRQGSADINTYKLFIELSHSLLRPAGRMSMIVKSGLYGDFGSASLRDLLVRASQLTELFIFQNERRVFQSVHHTEKMCIPFVQKSGTTQVMNLLCRTGIAGSPAPEEIEDLLDGFPNAVSINREQLERLSPSTLTIMEVDSDADFQILGRMFEGSTFLAAFCRQRGLKYECELHMTSDSASFVGLDSCVGDGYRMDRYGHWDAGRWQQCQIAEGNRTGYVGSADGKHAIPVDAIEKTLLPVFEGRSIGQFDFQRKVWVSGRGRRAVWRQTNWAQDKVISTQFGIAPKDYASDRTRWKFAFMDVAASNVERTMIGTVLDGVPCGNSAPVLAGTSRSLRDVLLVSAILNSFSYDFFARRKCTRLHLNWFVIEESPIPTNRLNEGVETVLIRCAARLALAHERFAPGWLTLRDSDASFGKRSWRSWWALARRERLRLRVMLDAIVADLYGLSVDDLRNILTGTDLPKDSLAQRSVASSLDSRTFWLTDREEHPELRHSILSFVAFKELKQVGLSSFLELNGGEGWDLPERLRLADYGLGHDSRAKEHQPVAAALGECLAPWQLGEDVEASWEDCRRHAEVVRCMMSSTQTDATDAPMTRPTADGKPKQMRLFEGAPPIDLVIKKAKGKKR